MDQFGISMSSNFDISVFSRKKELFYCTLEFSKKLDESLFIKFLVLMSKYYSDFHVYSESIDDKLGWKDFVIGNKFEFNKDNGCSLRISPIVYVQNNDEVLFIAVNNGIVVTFSWDSKKDCFNLLLDYYADVVTDKVYFFKEGRYCEKDQSIAAKKNRKILADWLKGVERLLDGEIVEYITDNHLTKDSVYKYGIVENARHITDYMGFKT